MPQAKGNPVLDPWYPWDFRKPTPADGRDGERFKKFLAAKTYIWYFIGYLLVPTLFLKWALLKGWQLKPGDGASIPWPVWPALLWVVMASWIAKALPDQLLKGTLAVNVSQRVRIGTTGLTVLFCLGAGTALLWLAVHIQGSATGMADWGTAVLLCPGSGLLFWALFYAVDFVKTFFQRSPDYHLDPWELPDIQKGKKGAGELEVAHWSDIHLTARDTDPSVAGDMGNNENFRKVLEANRPPLKTMDALLVSGDVADAGRASEWHVFFRDVKEKELFGKMVLVPGNHDMNIVDRSDWFMVEGQGRLLRKKRLIRTMAALNRIQGERAWILVPDKKRGLRKELLRKYLDGFTDPFREFLDELTRLQEREPGFWDYLSPPLGAWTFGKKGRLEDLAQEVDRAWEQIFPMAVQVRGVQALFIVLNSNIEDTGIVDNALGQLSPGALQRLENLHRMFADRPLIHSLHHHVALPHFHSGFFGEVQADMMALLNAGDLIQRLIPLGRSVVFHGHRHIGYIGTLNEKIHILSAPSVTLGNELKPKPKRVPGFYSFRVESKGEVRVTGRHFWH